MNVVFFPRTRQIVVIDAALLAGPVIRNTSANVINAAATWFFVTDDANTPTAIKNCPTNNTPRYPLRIGPMSRPVWHAKSTIRSRADRRSQRN